MKTYKSFEEIEYDLQRLQLERQISVEKLKEAKNDFSESFKPLNWVSSAAKFAGKYGVFMVAKNLFKKF
jgi:hypothetical protein